MSSFVLTSIWNEIFTGHIRLSIRQLLSSQRSSFPTLNHAAALTFFVVAFAVSITSSKMDGTALLRSMFFVKPKEAGWKLSGLKCTPHMYMLLAFSLIRSVGIASSHFFLVSSFLGSLQVWREVLKWYHDDTESKTKTVAWRSSDLLETELVFVLKHLKIYKGGIWK